MYDESFPYRIAVRSDEVIESENENPNEVYKVPVKAGFFNHFVVSALFIGSADRVDPNDNIDDNPAEYVEAVESCYNKEQRCKRNRPPGTVAFIPMEMVAEAYFRKVLIALFGNPEEVGVESSAISDEL